MIEVRGLSKRFGRTQVLTDISADFQKGKVNQIIGKSGSGKSVLCKCIVGLFEPEEGEVLYDGRSFHHLFQFTAIKLAQAMEQRFQRHLGLHLNHGHNGLPSVLVSEDGVIVA